MTISGILSGVPLLSPTRLKVTRYVNDNGSEWVLLVPPPKLQGQLLEHVAWRWLRDQGPPPELPVSFQPVPWIDARLGPAVLHHCPGRTVVYCSQENIADDVAVALSQIMLHSIGPSLQPAPCHGLPRFHIVSVENTWMPGPHRVIGVVCAADVRVYARSDLLSAGLATTLSTLGTEHLRCQLARAHGRPRLLRSAG
jgi:hypothetical protein